MGAQINFDNETMATIVTKAILEGISDEARDSIIQQAVRSILVAVEVNSYTREKKTPLQTAFENAVHTNVNNVVRELVENSAEIREKIDTSLGKLLSEYADTLRDEYDGIKSKVNEVLIEYLAERKSRGY